MILCPQCKNSNRDTASFCPKCGYRFHVPSSLALPPGTVLHNSFRIERLLGEGGFGRAYLSRQMGLNRLCVAKQMLIPPNSTPGDVAELQRVFEREARLLVELNQPGQQNIPEIYDFFSAPSGNFLVMKYIQGGNIEERIRGHGGKLPWAEAVKIVMQIAGALEYMHSRIPPVLHRDIKPSNILLDDTQRAWLIDFGLSKAQPSVGGKSGATTSAGTPGYAPLEQWLQQAVPASDLYALAATLHHLVTGRDPRDEIKTFDLPSLQKAQGNFPPIRSLNKALPSELESLIAHGISADPVKRPSASEWLTSLSILIAPMRGTVTGIQPFRFQTGETVRNIPEMAQVCDRGWDAAKNHLYRGDFEDWLVRQLNEHGLASQAESIRRQVSDQNAGLEKFIRLLDPKVPHVQVSISPSEVKFKGIGQTDPADQTISITGVGSRGYVLVQAQATRPWVTVTPASGVGLRPGQKGKLTVSIHAEHLGLGTTSDKIIITPDGQKEIYIPVVVHRSSLKVLFGSIVQIYNRIPNSVHFLASLLLACVFTYLAHTTVPEIINLRKYLWNPPELASLWIPQTWMLWIPKLLQNLGMIAGLVAVLGLGRDSWHGWSKFFLFLFRGILAGTFFGAVGLSLVCAAWIFFGESVANNIGMDYAENLLLGLSVLSVSLGVLYGISDNGIDKITTTVRGILGFLWGLIRFVFWIGLFITGGMLGYNIAKEFGISGNSPAGYAGALAGSILLVWIANGIINFVKSKMRP